MHKHHFMFRDTLMNRVCKAPVLRVYVTRGDNVFSHMVYSAISDGKDLHKEKRSLGRDGMIWGLVGVRDGVFKDCYHVRSGSMNLDWQMNWISG